VESVQIDPSSNGIDLRPRVLTSSTTWLVPGVRLTCCMLACLMPTCILLYWIYNSRRSFWMLPSICMYCCSNYCNTFMVVSRILSLISSRSPSFNTMGSPCDLSDFFFFLVPPCSSLAHLFRINGVLYPSSPLPPCPKISSSSISSKGDLSRFFDLCSSCYTCSLAVHSCLTQAFFMTSFFFYATRVCVTFLATSFLFCATQISSHVLGPIAKSDEVCHCTSHFTKISFTYVFFTK